MRYLDPDKGTILLNLPTPLPGSGLLLSQALGIGTLVATSDPGPTNDSTQGVSVGMVWFNSTPGALRAWMCRSAAPGAAAWTFEGADYANGGTNPNFEVTQFGLGSSLMAEEGNINRQVSGAGISPTAIGGDNILAVYLLPANSFDVSGRGIQIEAMGSFAGNAHNKDVKIIYNPTATVVGQTVSGGQTIADSGVVTTNGGGWSLAANVFKYGAAGSNTQLGLHQQAQIGGAVAALLAPVLLTGNESGNIPIVVTGNATTTASDIVFNFLEVNAMN